ncbi:PepSY domain-containing protein [Paenibacillus thiaminolyticus]|uniref:PepSY domain-containing protein n=1 Tax=Paenibacillus thiaminolyticus TaxID=49283 RepID=A0AAP9DX01_PANTH|nr:PepSY domain-containing protein [Paenibacillus thiaminolyticus]MCY9535290.1 PepSY domain-containing protein [Paenibacillus thiaminolyticus]MCY9602551.1 PepSY domain-containing protein [Paenibacillus thiaminolyticus]MCY9606203.1 PepSY domain-containing protein [Paenibacillus thiaminolyticus]MCY9612588.1 PepSY domain-containing protein [Paenibacillus thiaminolyticus]MCY9620783.1 PepSY domain-containing protein [Paenibacillus thiaminolyticus]
MKKAWLGAAVIAFFAIVVWQLVRLITFAEPLSAAEAASKVKEMYRGEVVEVSELPHAYRVTMELATGTYEVDIEKDKGNIGGMIRTQGAAPEPEAQPPAIQPDKQKPPAASKPRQQRITEEEAAAIALKTVSGEVDDIDLIQSDGVAYYLVEIDREDGEDGTVQINAITGEVKSVTWDD